MNRRQLFMGLGGVWGAWLTRRARALAAGRIPAAPVARVDVVRDVYFGETLSDPYRWMENDKDREWLPFLKGQNRHARTLLEGLPQRKALLARIEQLSRQTVLTSAVQRAGGLTFIEQRAQGADNYRLLVR